MTQYFIRLVTCSTIARRVKFKGESIKAASEECVEELRRDGGLGGVIVLDERGNCETFRSSFYHPSDANLVDAMPLNCEGMYRGVIKEDGDAKVAIFHDDVLT